MHHFSGGLSGRRVFQAHESSGLEHALGSSRPSWSSVGAGGAKTERDGEQGGPALCPRSGTWGRAAWSPGGLAKYKRIAGRHPQRFRLSSSWRGPDSLTPNRLPGAAGSGPHLVKPPRARRPPTTVFQGPFVLTAGVTHSRVSAACVLLFREYQTHLTDSKALSAWSTAMLQ